MLRVISISTYFKELTIKHLHLKKWMRFSIHAVQDSVGATKLTGTAEQKRKLPRRRAAKKPIPLEGAYRGLCSRGPAELK
jgi:hypothetical protein